MLKNLVQLEHKVGDKVFHFLCASDAQLDHVKDALVHFMGHVANVEDAAKAQATAAPVPPVSAEVPVVDPVVSDPSEPPATKEV